MMRASLECGRGTLKGYSCRFRTSRGVRELPGLRKAVAAFAPHCATAVQRISPMMRASLECGRGTLKGYSCRFRASAGLAHVRHAPRQQEGCLWILTPHLRNPCISVHSPNLLTCGSGCVKLRHRLHHRRAKPGLHDAVEVPAIGDLCHRPVRTDASAVVTPGSVQFIVTDEQSRFHGSRKQRCSRKVTSRAAVVSPESPRCPSRLRRRDGREI